MRDFRRKLLTISTEQRDAPLRFLQIQVSLHAGRTAGLPGANTTGPGVAA
jgi:hypothetical protein